MPIMTATMKPCGCVVDPAGTDVFCDMHAPAPNRAAIEERLNETPREPVRTQMQRREAWNQHDTMREYILWQARKMICDDRQEVYGSAYDSMTRIANFWNTYLGDDINHPLEADDVAMMMTLMKISRIVSNNEHQDSYVDACGYLALASEMANGMIASQGVDKE